MSKKWFTIISCPLLAALVIIGFATRYNELGGGFATFCASLLYLLGLVTKTRGETMLRAKMDELQKELREMR